MNRAEDLLDEEDWIELEKEAKPGAVLTDVAVSLSIAKPKDGKVRKARAYVVLRNEAAAWLKEHGPRFRVAIGGDKANQIRIASDAERGRFEWHNSVGGKSVRLSLGVVTTWPNEPRVQVEAKWKIDGGALRLTLPDDFAVARAVERREGAPPPRAVVVPPARSSNVVAMPGDPPPRSAARGRG